MGAKIILTPSREKANRGHTKGVEGKIAWDLSRSNIGSMKMERNCPQDTGEMGDGRGVQILI